MNVRWAEKQKPSLNLEEPVERPVEQWTVEL